MRDVIQTRFLGKLLQNKENIFRKFLDSVQSIIKKQFRYFSNRFVITNSQLLTKYKIF